MLKYLVPFVPFSGTTVIEFYFEEGFRPTQRKFVAAEIDLPSGIEIVDSTQVTVVLESDTASIEAIDRKSEGIYFRPEEFWDTITPTCEIYRDFKHGGAVMLDGNTVQFELPGDTEPIVFDEENEQTNRQRAAIYGALDHYIGGDLQETEPGTLPTRIASEGPQMIAAYRFAVHNESPARIADEMSMSQQQIIDPLRAVASK